MLDAFNLISTGQPVSIMDSGLISAEGRLTQETAVGRTFDSLAVPSPSKEAMNADNILNRIEVSKLGEATSSKQVDIRDVLASGELTEEKRKEIMKTVVEKHMMESTKLESDLRHAEIKEINEVIY